MALLENSPVSLPTGRPEASYADETAPVAVHDADFQNFSRRNFGPGDLVRKEAPFRVRDDAFRRHTWEPCPRQPKVTHRHVAALRVVRENPRGS